MSAWKKRLVWLVLPVTLIFFDQVTKSLIRENLARGEEVEVLEGFFRLNHVQNKGAAFGLFSGMEDGYRELFLTSLGAVALCLVIFYSLRLRPNDALAQTGLHLIFGGAVGNLIDRFTVGWVTDFLELYWGDFHWPAFNIADSVIVLGVAILLIDTFRPRHKGKIAEAQGERDDIAPTETEMVAEAGSKLVESGRSESGEAESDVP